MPIPKKKPITKKEIEDNDTVMNNEDITTEPNKVGDDCLDDANQNVHHISSIDEFDDDDLFANLDDIDGLEYPPANQLKTNAVDRQEESITKKEDIPEENVSKKIEVKESKPISSQTVAKQKNPIYKLSRYKITSITSEEFDLIKNLRLNEANISNYCLAKMVAYDYFQDYRDDFYFKKQWGFPYSGNYIGYIINCKRCLNGSKGYVVEFLANDYDVCLFKFTTSFRDAVYNGIQRDLGWVETIFDKPDYTCLRCFLVCISVENITFDNGGVYSKITDIKFLGDDEVDVIDKIIDDMRRR